MCRKLGVLWLMLVVVLSMSVPVFARPDTKKETRVEGKVVRRNMDKNTITVRVDKLNAEKTVNYDASTKWTSAYHNDKKANPIEPSEVKDGDQVICLGTYDDKGDFHATSVSKRLSHSE